MKTAKQNKRKFNFLIHTYLNISLKNINLWEIRLKKNKLENQESPSYYRPQPHLSPLEHSTAKRMYILIFYSNLIPIKVE